MVGGSLARRGRKGRLAMSMVIPMHKPGPDAVSKNCHPSLAERNNEFCWVLDFLRERKSGIHSCIALQQCLQGGGRFKTDAVANSKRKFYKVVVVVVVEVVLVGVVIVIVVVVVDVVAVVSWWVA